jgi:hypothetical protein
MTGAFNLVSGYSFSPRDLSVESRVPGISGFMRVKNGEDFVEQTLRSHIDFFDEIVVVMSSSTDATSSILKRLLGELSPRLRVFHYLDDVFPPGSEGHRVTPADDPRSMVNYSNFSLAQTRHHVACKIDDDHIAIRTVMSQLTERVRSPAFGDAEFLAFSGLNLIRGEGGRWGVSKVDPLSGGGDIGFFRVLPDSFFRHDSRFERVSRSGRAPRFGGFAYWHMKYLKTGLGFENYELEGGQNPRFERRRQRVLAPGAVFGRLDDLLEGLPDRRLQGFIRSLSAKGRFLNARREALEWFREPLAGDSVWERLCSDGFFTR